MLWKKTWLLWKLFCNKWMAYIPHLSTIPSSHNVSKKLLRMKDSFQNFPGTTSNDDKIFHALLDEIT